MSKISNRFRKLLAAILLSVLPGSLASLQAAATAAPLAVSVYADYDAELRESTPRSDGIYHVNTQALLAKLIQGNIPTYAYLVYHRPTDWDDFRLEFLPLAQSPHVKRINVWLYLMPPSEAHSNYPPYNLDYVAWATNTALLAKQYPVLTGLVIDDFYANQTLFTPSYVSNMMSAAHSYCTNLAFLPVNYDLVHNISYPTQLISPAFVNAYGPCLSGVILPYLNWTNSANYNDYSDENLQISNNSAILNGQIAQFVVKFPSSTPSHAGDYSALTQVITNAAGFPDAPRPFPFRVSDSYNGTTTGYHELQVLVDGVIVWQGDVAGANGVQDITLNLQAQLQGKTSAVLTVRLYDAKGASNFGVTASWNLPAGNWAVNETGAFVGTGSYYPANPGLNIPLIVMIYDGGYGGWKPTSSYLTNANLIAQAAVLSGTAKGGIIQYCLDKSSTSTQFPIVQGFYGQWILPTIGTQPESQTVLAGQSVMFSVSANGQAPFGYRWRFQGNPIAGATNSSYNLPSAQVTNSGLYSVLVTNPFGWGSILSSDAVLIAGFCPPIVVTDLQPLTLKQPAGQPIRYSVGAAGPMPIYYQWQFQGTNLADNSRIAGSQSNLLVITDAQYSDAGTYQLILTNAFGSTLSSMANVTVNRVALNNGAGWTLNGGAVITNNVLTLTDGVTGEARSSFLDAPEYIQSFTASFTYQESGVNPDDGIAFVIQNSSAGASALGGSGEGLGYSGISPSAALELDIYNNNSSIFPGIALRTNGGTGSYLSASPVSLTSGHPINVTLGYSSGLLSVTLTDSVTQASFSSTFSIDLPGLLGGNSAFVGFTGATGGLASTQTVSNFSFISLPALSSQPAGNGGLSLSWPASAGGFVLQQNSDLGTTTWVPVASPANLANNRNQVSVVLSNVSMFYRLVLQ